jgi:YidC/Oxa1 family membrane protein insertase
MDQQKRTLLAIGLMLGLTLVYTTFLVPQTPPGGAGLADGGVASVDGGTAESAVVVAPPTPTPAADADGGAQVAAAPEKQLEKVVKEISHPEMKVELSSDGAGLSSALLLGAREREQQHVSLAEGYQKLFGKKFPPPPQMNMVRPAPGKPLPFALSIEGAAGLPDSLRYEVAEVSDSPSGGERGSPSGGERGSPSGGERGSPSGGERGVEQVKFVGHFGPWEVEKLFSFKGGEYELKLDVSVKNTGATPLSGELTLHNARAIDPAHEEAPSFFGSIGNQASLVCQVGDKLNRKLPTEDAEKAHEEFPGPQAFAGIDQQYFFSALYLMGGSREGKCKVLASHTVREVNLAFPLAVAPGETVKLAFGGYIGPKDLERLKKVGSEGGVSPRLDRSVDFGWWAAICQVLLWFMRLCHTWTGNWGFSIIILTCTAKILLLPLTHKAMVSAENMKKLQPKMEEIRKKYADDKEKMNMETMKLYQTEKVNPLGGCLPLLLQLPIWAALFTTLRTSYDLYGMPFIGPVWTDLTLKDPTFILPLALGVTMFITQKLQPQMMDPAQAKMFLYFMPVFFTVIMLSYPAGLSLYIFTNNLLSIAQQYALRRYLKAKGLTAPDLPKKPEPAKR